MVCIRSRMNFSIFELSQLCTVHLIQSKVTRIERTEEQKTLSFGIKSCEHRTFPFNQLDELQQQFQGKKYTNSLALKEQYVDVHSSLLTVHKCVQLVVPCPTSLYFQATQKRKNNIQRMYPSLQREFDTPVWLLHYVLISSTVLIWNINSIIINYTTGGCSYV